MLLYNRIFVLYEYRCLGFLDDFGLSEGFCGNWNGDSLDDFIGGDNI